MQRSFLESYAFGSPLNTKPTTNLSFSLHVVFPGNFLYGSQLGPTFSIIIDLKDHLGMEISKQLLSSPTRSFKLLQMIIGAYLN